MYLSKSQILEAKDIESEVVKVPEWGKDGEVMVYGLKQVEKNEWTKSIMTGGEVDVNGATVKLCALCIRDEKGKRIFEDTDLTSLMNKSAKPIDRIFQVAQRLTGIGQEEIKETVKNSAKTPTKDSS
jgi:hypothetical protein